jgi:PAS domain S-box-containing protein
VTGHARAELIGTDFADYFTDPKSARAGYQKVFREGAVHDYPLEIRHKNSDVTPVLYNATVYRDESGKVIGVFAAARDISEIRRAQEALRLAGLYNRSLIEASIDPLVTIGPDGRITDVNAATENVTGRTRTEVIGTDFADYFTDPKSARAGYQKVFREGAVRDYSLEIRHKGGDVTPVLYNATVYRDEAGNVIGVFAAARDITETMKAQQRVRESEQTLRAYINATTESMMLIDTEGRVIDANETVCKRLGTTRKKLVGSILYDFLEGDHADERRRHVDKVIADRGPVVFEDIRQERYILNTMNPVLDADGEVTKIAVFGYDITELKKERELRELYEQLGRFADDLKRSNQELEQFAYVASHDLQEPLRIVSSYAQLLGKRYQGKLDADADDFIGYLVDGALRMQRLIDDLLALSRVGTRGKPFVPTDSTAVVKEAIENLAFAVQESGAKVTVGPLPTVDADAPQLVQLFQNLIGNAIKFRGENTPRVHISARRNKNEWIFSAKDNGIGIAPEYKDRIFVIFQRLHARDEYPGTGIGLAIARKIVERHGGVIWVDSQANEGATFHFTIPDHGGKIL